MNQGDPFTALWVSHTSIGDYLACPRAYFLKHVYRDPNTRHKIKLMAPALALGQAVHEVIEIISWLPSEQRMREPLQERFEKAWKQVEGRDGGFMSMEQEKHFYERGKKMIQVLVENPGPLKRLAVKLKEDLPHYWLSQEAGVILCGKIDWMEYYPEKNSLHIIDFKTGEREEASDSMQLPIYTLLASHCQKRPVEQVSYWYLMSATEPVPKEIPELEKVESKILKIAKEIFLKRKLNKLACAASSGCRYCRPLEAVIQGRAEFVGNDRYNYDVYVLPPSGGQSDDSSIIL